MKYIYILIGGSLGTLLRYLSSSWIVGVYPTSNFPWGTFFVNLTGSFVIGLLAGYNLTNEFNLNLRLFLFTGLLGGFTTYSGYAIETLALIKENNFMVAATYIIATTILGLALAAFGFWISTMLTGSKV